MPTPPATTARRRCCSRASATIEHSVHGRHRRRATRSPSMGDIDEALRIYARARMRAANHGFPVLDAMVEESVALLELARGRYREALAGLEGSRARYEQLAMPQHLAIAEKQLADAYLELRLLPEALALFERAIEKFTDARDARRRSLGARAARTRRRRCKVTLRRRQRRSSAPTRFFAPRTTRVGERGGCARACRVGAAAGERRRCGARAVRRRLRRADSPPPDSPRARLAPMPSARRRCCTRPRAGRGARCSRRRSIVPASSACSRCRCAA